jgi:hypothetical protein
MTVTIIYRDRPPATASEASTGDRLWLTTDDLRGTTGWELKPEGACQGDLCIPIPRGREHEFVREGGRQFNLSAFADLLDQPVVSDDARSIWVVGESAGARREALASLEAPDFSLPDLDGRLHSLSEQRGKKVLLVSWASW